MSDTPDVSHICKLGFYRILLFLALVHCILWIDEKHEIHLNRGALQLAKSIYD